MFYIVVEVQITNGTPITIAYAFTEEGEAKAKYYTILSVACKTTLDKHGAYYISSDGGYAFEMFSKHETPEAVS